MADMENGFDTPPTPPADSPDLADVLSEDASDRGDRRRGRTVRSSGWIGGAILILLGLVFLLQNVGVSFLENWWALFILIPAFGSFAAAWQSYQSAGRLTRQGSGSLVGGVFLTALALVFLIDLNIFQIWPYLLILCGVIVLITALLPD